ncbi:MAG: hypothetical protein IT382_00510 [Deltaproteobacteria bacterium]|nr:hypothetical protein [Deltaproteobacteria bacterium]
MSLLVDAVLSELGVAGASAAAGGESCTTVFDADPIARTQASLRGLSCRSKLEERHQCRHMLASGGV